MIVVLDGYNFIILGGVEVLLEVLLVEVVVLLVEVVVVEAVLLVVGRELIIIWGPREVEVAMERVVVVMVGGRVDHHLRNGCHPCIINSSSSRTTLQ
jgi:hypothetical protein